MGKTGVINRDFTGEENNVYHDVIWLFKIYRAVNWRMQIKVNQVKHRIREEYGTDLDEFLDSIYQAGMDINQDLDDMKQRIEVINRSNKFLKLIDEAVELMRNFHPQGERYYWVLYYSYMSARKAENIDEILDLLEPHFQKSHEYTGQLISGGESRHFKLSAVFCGDMKTRADRLLSTSKIILKWNRYSVDMKSAKYLY